MFTVSTIRIDRQHDKKSYNKYSSSANGFGELNLDNNFHYLIYYILYIKTNKNYAPACTTFGFAEFTASTIRNSCAKHGGFTNDFLKLILITYVRCCIW